MSATAKLSVQRWGNSLAVRIPAAVARSARLRSGQVVEVSASADGVSIKLLGDVRSSLAQKLTAFDPEIHGGEVMATTPIGREAA